MKYAIMVLSGSIIIFVISISCLVRAILFLYDAFELFIAAIVFLSVAVVYLSLLIY
jgi:hypothetical protein